MFLNVINAEQAIQVYQHAFWVTESVQYGDWETYTFEVLK
jgi:hypothetical protein